MSDDKPVVLGRISGLFGVKGWLKIHSYTDPREAILDYDGWLLERNGTWNEAMPAEGKRHGKTVIVRLVGVEDRESAAQYVNAVVGVSREKLPVTGDKEYYWSDLEGLQVIGHDGKPLGRVAYLLATGANDVLVVQGDKETLIPFITGDVIESVDLANGEIHVNWDWD